MKLLPVSQVHIFDQIIQNFNQIRKEFNVDDVRESKKEIKITNQLMLRIIDLDIYFARPSNVELRRREFGLCFKILK